MTRRAVALGFVLGLLLSGLTYFNDWIIGQTMLIGNFLPISIFGSALALALLVNPILHRLSHRLPLGGGEILIMAAVAMSACGFPASSFYRYLTPVSALPAHWHKTMPNWQSTGVMSYVPGASASLAEGHLQDAPRVVARIRAASAESSPSAAGRVWQLLSDDGRRQIARFADQGQLDLEAMAALTRLLNEVLTDPALYDATAFPQPVGSEARRALGEAFVRELDDLLAQSESSPDQVVLRNRLLLVSAFPGAILPPPRGRGALVMGGSADPLVVDTLLQGRSSTNRLSLTELPWRQWWPTLRLWGVAALLLGLSAFCLALIVHPQWSRRELLPYPLVRFLRDATERQPGQALPDVARQRSFWVAFAVVSFWHLLNGLHAWFPEVPQIPRTESLWRLNQIFPNAARVNGQYGWFAPTLYLSVTAFTFFMSRSVAFGLGISQVLFFMLGSALIVNGVELSVTTSGASPSNLLRFGGYAAAALIILYTGRRYYRQVLTAAVGRARSQDVPASAAWAARGLAVCALGAAACLQSAGAGWFFALIFVLLSLVAFVVVTRIVTETGSFFVQLEWGVAAVVTALFGFEAVGPTTFVLLALATRLLIPDLRETLMPFVTNGLAMAEHASPGQTLRASGWFLLTLCVGFVVAGAATFYFQYNHSVIQVGNDWATHQVPKQAFDTLARLVSDARGSGSLLRAAASDGGLSLDAVAPASGALWWTALGFALVLGTSVARLRLPWWPLHPVAFLVWDTYPIITFGPSFLLGWILASAVVSAGGARAHRAARPLVVGVIAGELSCGLFWIVVGIAYYFTTGQRPVSYSIFPL